MNIAFGVDIGGTQIKLGAFDKNGILIEQWSTNTDLSDNGNRIIPDVASSVQEYIVRHHIPIENVLGIGLGIPGPVDANGYVKKCVNLKWTEFSPVTELARFLPNTRIAAENDANVAALGEYYKGSGKGYASMMMVTLGTGVGGGLILNGKIFSGAHGIAGEIGHIATNLHAAGNCECGNKGCINECSSATGLVRYTKRLLENDPQPSKLREYSELTAKTICDCAKAGDAIAIHSLTICMEPLGIGLAHFSHAIDPEVYVIGGGVSRAGELILKPIQKGFESNLHLISKGADICLAKLGNDAGIIGACMLVTGK
jgi:glucokinase